MRSVSQKSPLARRAAPVPSPTLSRCHTRPFSYSVEATRPHSEAHRILRKRGAALRVEQRVGLPYFRKVV
jgi:hypothetical protein